jgi:glutamyl-Q tRNA(Asp) synthetase
MIRGSTGTRRTMSTLEFCEVLRIVVGTIAPRIGAIKGLVVPSAGRSQQVVTTRFAPSPNGELHLGHARSALIAHDWAGSHGGRFLVRIEDIDTARTRNDFVSGIFDDLGWLGLTWQEPVLHQSRHFHVYRDAADRLAAMGLLYPCFASRNEILAASDPTQLDPDGVPLYPGIAKCRSPAAIAADMAAGLPFALRLDMDRALELARHKLAGALLTFTELDANANATTIEAHPERWGDAIIVRKDTPASYHLAVVVDDARQGITHGTRGRDLFAATGIHRLLQVLLDLPEPLYHHHPLVTDADGRKLAKSAGDTSLRALRAGGIGAAEVIRRAMTSGMA